MYHENGITKSVLLSSKLKMLKGDPSISYCYKNDKLSRIVAIHVDIIPAFSKIFVTGKTSKNAFRYLGLDMKQNECKLIYQKLGNDNDLRIIVHSDAAYGNLPNGILMLLTETFQMEIVKEAILYFYAVIEICVFH